MSPGRKNPTQTQPKIRKTHTFRWTQNRAARWPQFWARQYKLSEGRGSKSGLGKCPAKSAGETPSRAGLPPGPAMDTAALKRRLDALTEEVKSVRGELRQSTKRWGPKGGISEWKWKVGCAIIVLSDGNFAAGVSYVLLGTPETDGNLIEEYRQKFEAWWNSCSAESRENTVLRPANKQGKAALERARRVIAEQDLVRWVHDVNLKHGIAPDTSALNSRRAPMHQCVSSRTRTQWGRRWRRRWSIDLGRFAARERLSKEDKSAKAQAMWQWANWLTVQIRPPKQALRINMDETCVRLHMTSKLGHVCIEAVKQKSWADPLSQNVSLAQQRASCSLVALITDYDLAQPYLPQMLIIGRKSLTAQQRAEVEQALPDNVILYSGKNGWMNVAIFKALIRRISQRLTPFKNTHQVIFSSDTYPCHLSKESITCLVQHGMWPHLVPAKMTWALQPLDVYAFAKFKSRLSSTWQSMQVSMANPSKLEWTTMIRAIAHTVQDVICGQSWKTAFERTGLTGNMEDLSEHVLAKVGMTERPTLTTRLPSATELACIFPKSYVELPIDELFGPWTEQQESKNDGGDGEQERTGLPSSSGRALTSAGSSDTARRRHPVGVPLYPWLSQARKK